MDLRATLQQLTQASGPTGNEESAAALVKELMAPLCDDVKVDPLFTVIGLKRGQGRDVPVRSASDGPARSASDGPARSASDGPIGVPPEAPAMAPPEAQPMAPPEAPAMAPRPQLALMAHIDEIHLLVTALEGPFLRFTQHGYDPRLLVGQEVVVVGRQPLQGVIGDRAPHVLTVKDRTRMPRTEDLVIDLGLETEDVAANVAIGDAVLIEGPLTALLGERVAGKALDNRLGVATLLATLDILQGLRHSCDILAIANSGEELNNLGAAAAAFRLHPDLAVVIDVTFGAQPGAGSDETFPLGGGPVIGIGPNLHPGIAGKLADVAADLEMEHGLEPLPSDTGTDAWMVEVTAGGIPCGLVSIPLRNMHSPVEVADLKDATRTARLLASFVAQVDQSFIDSLTYRLPDFAEAAP